jgi:AmmeMemoRadiSam system protein A
MSANFAYLNTRDLKFIVKEWLPTERIFAYPRYADYYSKDDVDAILDPCLKMAKELIEPTNEDGDKNPVTFENGKVKLPESFGPLYKQLQSEGPFGVGYLTAGIKPGAPRESLLQRLQAEQRQEQDKLRQQESPPVKWARMVIENHVRKKPRPVLPVELEHLRKERAGVFVSLKKHGQLRGCIGTISPAYGNLAEEITNNAVSSASEDPRFLPVEIHELDDLVYSVDILGKPEPATREQLDPKRYGVIVSLGGRRGLLLPDLEGVDTVEEQLRIACQKAGIRPDENYVIERFEVIRYT